MDIIITGFLLGGTYALIAFGLNMQYGVARIMNLANGEFLVLGALAAFWIFVADAISPILTMLIVAPLSFFGNWVIYKTLLQEYINANYSSYSTLVMGIAFLVIVYFLPQGVVGRIEQLFARRGRSTW